MTCLQLLLTTDVFFTTVLWPNMVFVMTKYDFLYGQILSKTPGGDTPPPPSVFGFGMCGRNYIKTYINNKKNNMKNISEKHTKHGPNIVKNRAPRLQKPWKIIKNEFWNSKGEFWNGTWRRIVPEVVPEVTVLPMFSLFWAHFGSHFW